MTDTTQHDEELAQLKAQVVAQQARIASLKDVIEKASYAIEAEQFHVTEKILALATTDDLSALKAHDDALWNEALTTGIEWQATRGHTLDADDYGNELRSLKR